jgi:hypothetical protein
VLSVLGNLIVEQLAAVPERRWRALWDALDRTYLETPHERSRWAGGPPDDQGDPAVEYGHVVYSDAVQAVQKGLYGAQIVNGRWSEAAVEATWLDDKERFDDLEQAVLAAHRAVRGERFSDGFFKAALDSGRLYAALAVIRAWQSPPPADDLEWDTIGRMPDCAIAAVGDHRLFGDGGCSGGRLPGVVKRAGGYGLVYARAECDGLPVEVATSGGATIAARLQFTSDVAALQACGVGRWLPSGSVRMGSGAAAAFDTRHHGPPSAWFYPLRLAGGSYLVEAFCHEGDCLGVRLRRRPRPTRPAPAGDKLKGPR